MAHVYEKASTRWWLSAKCQRWRKAAASKIVRAIGIEVMHKQAYIHDGHFDSRAEERGAVSGGLFERLSMRAGESG